MRADVSITTATEHYDLNKEIPTYQKIIRCLTYGNGYLNIYVTPDHSTHFVRIGLNRRNKGDKGHYASLYFIAFA